MGKGKVEFLPDKEFIQLCKNFDSLDEVGQVNLIISLNDTANWHGLFQPVAKIIKGKSYTFGFLHKNQSGYNRILNLFLGQLIDHIFNIRKQEFDARFEKLLAIERTDFLNAEILAIQEFAKINDHYQRGYSHEVRHFDTFSSIASDKPYSFFWVASGAAGRKMELILRSILDVLAGSSRRELMNEHTEFETFEDVFIGTKEHMAAINCFLEMDLINASKKWVAANKNVYPAFQAWLSAITEFKDGAILHTDSKTTLIKLINKEFALPKELKYSNATRDTVRSDEFRKHFDASLSRSLS